MTDIAQIRAKREAAERARSVSRGLADAGDRARILAYAAELDAQADALERVALLPTDSGKKDP